MQEDILRQFSKSYFVSFKPNSMKLQGFDDFIMNFINLLTESPHMDSARIYVGHVTRF